MVVNAYSTVCEGQIVANRASPYAGDGLHPLVIVTSGVGPGLPPEYPSDWEDVIFTSAWNSDTAPPPGMEPTSLDAVQLVACVNLKTVDATSCGTYQRSDGVSGEVRRDRGIATIRILAAHTGALVAQKTMEGSAAPCQGSLSDYQSLSDPQKGKYGPPPWAYHGSISDASHALDYLVGFMTGPTRSSG